MRSVKSPKRRRPRNSVVTADARSFLLGRPAPFFSLLNGDRAVAHDNRISRPSSSIASHLYIHCTFDIRVIVGYSTLIPVIAAARRIGH